jgi:hypothetical protein
MQQEPTMKTSTLAAMTAVIALATSSIGAFANGVPDNPITGTPGNSAAARDLLPGAQANCHGDLMSAAAKNGLKDPQTAPKGQDRAAVNGNIFLLGSVIGVIPLDQCSDVVNP